MAEQKARHIDGLDCSPEMKRRAHSVVGSALMKQGRYEEAVLAMEGALEPAETDIRSVYKLRFKSAP